MKKKAINLGSERYVERFSLGIEAGGMVFASGQGPIDMSAGEVRHGTIEQETELTLKNLADVLAGAGCTLDDCVKVTVHLADLADYDGFNAAYRGFFEHPLPARTVVQSVLNFGIKVEIDAIAMKRPD